MYLPIFPWTEWAAEDQAIGIGGQTFRHLAHISPLYSHYDWWMGSQGSVGEKIRIDNFNFFLKHLGGQEGVEIFFNWGYSGL